MEFLKLLFLISLVTEIAVYGSDAEMEPINYEITVIPHTEATAFSFSGTSYITIRIHFTTSTISLHIMGLTLNETATSLMDKKGIFYKPRSYTYQHKKSIVDITFRESLQPGHYTLYINFNSNQSMKYEDSLYNNLYEYKENKAWMAQKPFPTIAIRDPCSSHVQCIEYKELWATFNIIVEHDHKYRAVSNMPVLKKHTKTESIMLSYFNTTPRMSSTSIMVIVFNFVCLSDFDHDVNIWCRLPKNVTSEVHFAHNIAMKIKHHIVQYLTNPNQSTKTDLIAVPHLPMHYLGNQGLIFYNEKSITYNSRIHPISHKIYVAITIADGLLQPLKLAFSDSWLSNGITIFYRTYMLDKIFPSSQLMNLLVVESLHGSLNTDDANLMESLDSELNNRRRINTNLQRENYEEMVYSLYEDKAPAIVRMLQHIVSEEVFQKGIAIFLQTIQSKSMTAGDLWAAMNTALKNSNILHHYSDINKAMEPWVKQKYYPLLTVTRNYTSGKTIISQESSDLLKDRGEIDGLWWIPLTYTTQSQPSFIDTLPKGWLTPSTENISFNIASDDWIIVNLQRTGYYRVNYDNTNWLKIANYLNSDNYKIIHVLNRAQLIEDAFYFMFNHNLESSIFFNISNYIWRETEYVVWYPMFKILFKLQKFFELPETKTFKSRIAASFDALLERLEYENNFNTDDIRTLKYINATHWACTIGNTQCLKMAATKLEEHLSYKSKLIPNLYRLTYCFGLKTADESTWDRVWHLYQKTYDLKLLEFLACSEDPNIAINYLQFIGSINTNLSDTERIFAFRSVIKRHMRNDVVLEFLLRNLKQLKPKLISMCDALREIISNIYTEKQLFKISESIKTIVKEECMQDLALVIEERMNYIDDIIYEYNTRVIKPLIPAVRNNQRNQSKITNVITHIM